MHREDHGRNREFDAVFLSSIYCHSIAPRDVSREVSLVGAVYHSRRIHQLPLVSCVTNNSNKLQAELWKPKNIIEIFIGNFQEACGMRTGWGAVILAEAVALIAASTVHRVCITTCFLFSAGLLYEINKISGVTLSKSELKTKRH
ncbi:hypothetical protein DITRI_Ditri05aG0116300 [Diplodiscus trichospermus]